MERVAPVREDDYRKEIEAARRDLRALISSKQYAPIMLRLAWRDACTYDANKKTGGPNGSIRNDQELRHSANAGLKDAVNLCEEVKKKYPTITYADLYQLAGVVAVEITGGPSIDFKPGRKDSHTSPEEERLNLGADHPREVCYRMGLSDKDIVALSRGHMLGRAHPERPGFEGSRTNDPLKFDNSYFVGLLKDRSQGLPQPATDNAQDPEFRQYGEVDKVLVQDPEFRQYVELYAKDEEAFFRDYAASHKKLSELGFVPPSSPMKEAIKNNNMSLLGIGGVVVAAVLVVFKYFFRKKH